MLTTFAEVFARVISALALIAAIPVLAAAALAIWLEDGRPIFFLQQRVGKLGRLFLLVKLRTMRQGGAGQSITASGDTRVTRVGRFLRKYKFDELPQLANVVAGDMNLIGPRPEVPQYVDLSNPLWQKVLSVKPGVTDIATLAFRHEEEILAGAVDAELCYRTIVLPRKLAISACAVSSRSTRADLRLLAYTVLCSFFPTRFDSESLAKSLGAGVHEEVSRIHSALKAAD
jgi:lipopolysaccharide/colanic/teichoic acid biosynthesis glycosyltransferase